MKARRLRGLDAEMPLADAAERIVAVRLAELCGLADRAQDGAAVAELHDTRIAAKRLRYVLEITAPCFGPYAESIHGVDERVHLPSMVQTAQALALFIRDWCGLKPAS